MKIYNYYLFLLSLSLSFLFSSTILQAEANTSLSNKKKVTTDESKLEKEDLQSFSTIQSSITEEDEEDVDVDEESQNKTLVLSISKGKYYTGATVGSVLGLGLGHLIQGRYQIDNAWLYSVVESAFIGGMIFAYNAVDSNYNVLKGSSESGVKASSKNKFYSAMFGLLGVGVLSCKLFEISSLWVEPKANKTTGNYDLYSSLPSQRVKYSWNIKLTGINQNLKFSPGLFLSANF